MDEIAQQLRCLIAEVSSSKAVQLETRLFHDLRLGGDDVTGILDRIAEKYGTSFSGFSFADFFHEEHEALGGHLWASIDFRSSKRTVTVQHLVDVVRRGVWFDPQVG